MRTIDVTRRSGVAVAPERSVRETAEIMEQSGVGALAVVDGAKLVGIVTDRDLVRRALARGMPLDTRVDSVMSSPVVTIASGADVHDTFALFRAHGVRRLAVVRGEQFVGMITVDDLLVELAADLGDLTGPVGAEILRAHHNGGLPVTA